ncbi:MAG TPA: tRNA lysidine(34) synthetase TilS [Thermomicrobiales bacterium]|nr:tRNA lysidine(34) synthetase TilS [Thermomicrobiales bacterium]
MARPRTPNAIVQRFLHTIQALELSRDPVGIAFSGGPDSLALAICAAEAKRAQHLHPTLLHIDHQTRPSSSSEAEHARDLATSLNLPFQARRIAERTPHTEDALRAGRYNALAAMVADLGSTLLLTGHHADDQAETVLLNLIRGTGPQGAIGMRSIRPLPNHPPITLLRPFLAERRTDLATLVASRNLVPVSDPSNTDPVYRRNLIRHQVLPLLEEVVPGAASHLATFAGLLADDNTALDQIASEALGDLASREILPLSIIASQPPAIASRILRLWVHAGAGLILSHERTVALLTLAAVGRGGAVIEIGEGIAVSRVGRTLKMHTTFAANDGD